MNQHMIHLVYEYLTTERIRDKMKLPKWIGRHYAIERFGVLFVSLLTILALCAVSGFASDWSYNAKRLTTISAYTKDFEMSRTDAKGQLVGVYTNDERTKAFILLKFDDISQVSANANDYQMFLGPRKVNGNDTHIKEAPNGQIFVFGTTGYVGLVFEKEEPFKSQVLDVTLRGNSEIVPVTAKVDEETGKESFAKYDQTRFVVNFGATNVQTLSALNNDTFDVEQVFKESVLDPADAKVKEELNKSLLTMKAELTAIDEYQRRAKEMNIDGKTIVIPDLPKEVKGDSVVSASDDENKFYLKTGYVFPRGYNFNWQDHVVGEYGAQVRKDGKSLFETMRLIRGQKDSSNSSGTNAVMDFKLSDGTTFKELLADSSAVSIVKEANVVLTNYLQSIDKYKTTKSNYQTDLLVQLLDLELQKENVAKNYTINNSEDVLKVYGR